MELAAGFSLKPAKRCRRTETHCSRSSALIELPSSSDVVSEEKASDATPRVLASESRDGVVAVVY